MRSLEVLLIEDSPIDARLIREGLNRSCGGSGISVRIAGDGEKALEILLGRRGVDQISDRYRPDMVLLDLGLPKIDGMTVLQRIRSGGVDLSSIPVIVFSSSTHCIQDVLDAGANAYIVKPAGLMDYLKAIERFAVLWLKALADAA